MKQKKKKKRPVYFFYKNLKKKEFDFSLSNNSWKNFRLVLLLLGRDMPYYLTFIEKKILFYFI
jgi:hypothetical protein